MQKDSLGLVQTQVQTPLGRFYLVASSKGLRYAGFRKQSGFKSQLMGAKKHPVLDKAARQLSAYFAGNLKTFTVPYDWVGTEFQQKVWKELARIPFGKTVSYRDIAEKSGSPKAFRAVGNANGKNPICILVPCHRVIASDGSIGGYSGGIKIKKALLGLESRKS